MKYRKPRKLLEELLIKDLELKQDHDLDLKRIVDLIDHILELV